MTWPIPDPVAALLVLARIAGLLLTAPLLAHALVPPRVRVALAGVLALALAPVAGTAVLPAVSLPGFVAAIAVETAVGAMLGFIGQLVFAGVQLGGQLAGLEMGFGMANLLDPQSSQQSTVVAEWQQLLALLVFLALDVHHVLIAALAESFRVAPVGAAVVSLPALEGLGARGAEMFAIGVRLAAPVLIVLLLVNATLGVLARTIPQLNVFVVGFPVNVGAGLLVLGASLPFAFRFLAERFVELRPLLGWLVRGMSGG